MKKIIQLTEWPAVSIKRSQDIQSLAGPDGEKLFVLWGFAEKMIPIVFRLKYVYQNLVLTSIADSVTTDSATN